MSEFDYSAPDCKQWPRCGCPHLYECVSPAPTAPTAPAVAVPPLLLSDALIDEIDCAQGWQTDNARKVGLRLYARAIEAAVRRQFGVRS